MQYQKICEGLFDRRFKDNKQFEIMQSERENPLVQPVLNHCRLYAGGWIDSSMIYGFNIVQIHRPIVLSNSDRPEWILREICET